MNLDLPVTRRRSLMSLTPLIDVVFILLLFFMLASNFSQERSVTWTSASKGAKQLDDLPLESSQVYVQSKERYLLDGTTISQSALFEALAIRYTLNPLHSTIISVSEEIDVQTLLDLISGIKNTGINRVVMNSSGNP